MNFPLDAAVQCTDGPCGQSTTIIVDPATDKVTHLAVKDPDRAHTEYLVPVDQIEDTTPNSIQLRCSCEELAAMDPFIETEFIEMPMSYYAGDMAMGYGYMGPEMAPVEHELIPEGKVAVRQGMAIEATDGYVGAVDELVVDRASNKVTHFVLRAGHLWGETDVTLPVEQVERVEGHTIHLKLDKESIEVMPVVQARRHYSKKEINILEIVLLIFTFEATGQADEAQRILKTLDKEKDIEIRNTAVIIKAQDGKTVLKEAEDVDAKHGALFGAVTGGLIGLLGGPIGVIVGAAAGAATGSVVADKIDRGFSDEYLHKLLADLQPGHSALVTLVEQALVDKVVEALAPLQGQLAQQRLTDEIVTRLTAKNNQS